MEFEKGERWKVKGRLRRTVGSDWRFTILSRNHRQSHLTLKMSAAYDIEMSVATISPSQDSFHLDHQISLKYVNAGFHFHLSMPPPWTHYFFFKPTLKCPWSKNNNWSLHEQLFETKMSDVSIFFLFEIFQFLCYANKQIDDFTCGYPRRRMTKSIIFLKLYQRYHYNL